MSSIKFRTRSTAKRKATAPLYLRVTDGADIWIKLSTLVDPLAWNNRTGKFKDTIKNPESETAKKKIQERTEIENKLDGLTIAIRTAMNKTERRDKEWLQDIVNEFYNPSSMSSVTTLNEYIAKYISDAESGLKQTLSKSVKFAPGTMKTLRAFQTQFNEFQGMYSPRRIKEMEASDEALRKRKIIDYDDITIDFYRDFVQFFNNKNYSANTTGKYVKCLKTIMTDAKENKKHNNTEFKRKAFKAMNCEVETVALDENELMNLYVLNLPDKAFKEARDLFLIGCWTCQRFSDYSRINKITTLDDGTKVIKIRQQKTKQDVSVPVDLFGPHLYKLLMSYSVDGSECNLKLPRVHDTDLNANIKSICRMAGITENVEIHETRGGLQKSAYYQKCTQIFSHTARRSAATNLVNRGMPTYYVMMLGGWKTEREFLKYVKLTPDQVAKKLKSMNYYIAPESRLRAV